MQYEHSQKHETYMHEYFIAIHCQKYICLIKCVLKRNKWKFMNRYEQFSMSPKIFLNFNLLRTDQINCNRLAAYSFACFNKRYVCQITGDRQKERVKKKLYIYGKSNCNSTDNTNSNINILPSLNNFHIENMYNSDTNRTFIVAGKIY